MPKIFLGGTVGGSKWRGHLIPMLEIDYFDPVVPEWTEAHQKEELRQRKACDYVLYTLTSDTKGLYSVAEVVDDSNKQPEKTILCVLPKGFAAPQLKSLKAVAEMVRKNGGKVFWNLGEVAGYVNRAATYDRKLVKLEGRRTDALSERQASIEGLGLAKLAASYDARRGKQYWQLLKRLYGGNDEAITAIKETRDPGIYHGTEASRVPQILDSGLKTGSRNMYGPGVYMASHDVAKGFGGFTDDPPALVRLALPSELKGTNELYPNVQQAVKIHPNGAHLLGSLEDIVPLRYERKFGDRVNTDPLIQKEIHSIINKDDMGRRSPSYHRVATYGRWPTENDTFMRDSDSLLFAQQENKQVIPSKLIRQAQAEPLGLAKLAAPRFRDTPLAEGLKMTALAVPLGLIAAKGIHSELVNHEPEQDIRAPLAELSTRKERMQAVRTRFADQFKELQLPVVDDAKTGVRVHRSMFPWKDNYSVDVTLHDHDGEPISDWNGYMASVHKDKDGDYEGNVDFIFTRENMQGKGVGRATENRMVQAFKDLGVSKSRLMPAFDGPAVWGKKDFGYHISPDSKATFLKAYRKWTKKHGVLFKDLGDTPSDYPAEFLKDLKDYEPFWSNTYYEKPLS